MKRWMRLWLGLTLGLFLAFNAVAQQAPKQTKEKKAAKARQDRLSGRIQMINKDASTITLDRNNVRRTVVYSPETKVTFRNKPGTMDDVKEGRRIIALGKFNDKSQLVATRIDVREGR